MKESVDPIEVYESLFDADYRRILDALGDPVNRALFAYVAENEEPHLDDVYGFLSESKTIEQEYDDFRREDVKSIGNTMHWFVSQQVASADWGEDPNDVYFSLTSKGEELAEAFEVGEIFQ